MSFIAAAGNVGFNSKAMDFFKKKGLAKKAAASEAMVGEEATAVDGGGDAGTKLDQIKSIVGGGAEQAATAVAPVTAQPKKKGGMWGGIGKALTGGLSGLFYKMPASGAKYGNSPIEKNYGSPAQRGFHAPNKLKTFGVGDSNKEKMAGVGSDLLDK